MKIKRILSLVFFLAALILELLPYGAVCNFADAEGENIRQTFSYFSFLPYGYGNIGPFITGVLTVIAVIAAALALFLKMKTAGETLPWICGAGAIASLLPLIFGISFYSLVGGLITACLVGGLACSITVKKE